MDTGIAIGGPVLRAAPFRQPCAVARLQRESLRARGTELQGLLSRQFDNADEGAVCRQESPAISNDFTASDPKALGISSMILLTGATRIVGRHVASNWAFPGVKARALVRRSEAAGLPA